MKYRHLQKTNSEKKDRTYEEVPLERYETSIFLMASIKQTTMHLQFIKSFKHQMGILRRRVLEMKEDYVFVPPVWPTSLDSAQDKLQELLPEIVKLSNKNVFVNGVFCRRQNQRRK